MKGVHVMIIGMIVLLSGVLSLPLILVFNLSPDTGIVSVGLVIGGLIIAFYGMLKPLNDEDFSQEELRRMGR